MRRQRFRLFVLALIAFAAAPHRVAAQSVACGRPKPGDTCVDRVSKAMIVFHGAAGNLVLYSGQIESILVGVPDAAAVDSLRRYIAARKIAPVKRIVMFESDLPAMMRMLQLAADTATVFAHERLRERLTGAIVADTTGASTIPIGFSDVIQLNVEGEEIHAVHQPTGYAETDVLVHFERANVLAFGMVVIGGEFPAISPARRGDIAGVRTSIERFLHGSASTVFVPGRGRLLKTPDLNAYHDALKATEDQIADLVNKKTALDVVLQQVHLPQIPGIAAPDAQAEKLLIRATYEALSRSAK